MIIVRAAAKVVFRGVCFTFSEGALHSDGDAPALRITILSHKKVSLSMYIVQYRLERYGGVTARWSPNIFGSRIFDVYDELRWYDRGELHRGFGPAIIGRSCDGVAMYWLKYFRGQFGGESRNSFGGDGAHFECAPGAVICAYSKSAQLGSEARVYQNSGSRVIEARGGKYGYSAHTAIVRDAPVEQTYAVKCTVCD